jgi:phospholipid/cholesterol/gamma-HCH transport system permease protein
MVTAAPPIRQAEIRIEDSGGTARLVLVGELDSVSTAAIWASATDFISKTTAKKAVIDASGVTFMDGFGAGLLLDVRRRAIPREIEITVTGLKPDFEAMLAPFEVEKYVSLPPSSAREHGFIEGIGSAGLGLVQDLYGFIEFTGEIARALMYAALHPRSVRWGDVYRTAVVAGADAIPLIMLVGFLIGFVMAFQAVLPLRQFGADAFLPALVGIAMLRELGPIMTALGLAGRSGAAFAAEIGTMKVNEEVSALITMGLAPVSFLIVPRIIAAVLITPFLIVFANVAGLLGGWFVFVTIGFPSRLYFEQLQMAVGLNDLLGGLFKGFVFGFLVASVGCMRGLQTRTGASAVGTSTTSAVVTSIVLVAIGNGIFAIIYYYLGI